MELTSCSVRFRGSSADPEMSLDYAETGASCATASAVAIYGDVNGRFDATLPGDAQFRRFLDQMSLVAERIRRAIAERAPTSFHGKGWFCKPGLLRFRYQPGAPGSYLAPGEPLWDDGWTKKPRQEYPHEVELQTADVPELETGEEPKLGPEVLAQLRPRSTGHEADDKKSASDIFPSAAGAAFYRVCFCCRYSADSYGSSVHLLCWLHPVLSDSSWQTARLQRLKLAALNNYLCEFDRLPGDVSSWLTPDTRAQLFFAAVQKGNWAAADWLRSGPGGVDAALDASGDTALTRLCYFCEDHNAIAGLLARGADRRRRDANGNSVLHRLAASLNHIAGLTESNVQPVLSTLAGDLRPRELAQWLAEENSDKDRPLALVSSGPILKSVLQRLMGRPGERQTAGDSGADAAAPVPPSEVLGLLSSSTGFSLVLSFAAFGVLKDAEDVVTHWLGASKWRKLLAGATVESGQLRGLTPMLAACQEGKWHNVKYLGQQLCQPPSVAAVDLAIGGRHLDSYESFNKFVTSALPKPDFVEALGILDRVEDCLTAVGSVAGNQLAPVEFRLQRAAPKLSDNNLIEALRLAFEHDSADSLCALVGCSSRGGGEGGSGEVTWRSLLSGCREDAALLGKLISLGKLHEFYPEQNERLPGLLGLALRCAKWRLAGQLLVCRQTDLLPACLLAMLWLRRLISSARKKRTDDGGEQKRKEQMEELYEFAKRTFCGAMVRLHKGTVTDSERGLVLNYLGGRFHQTEEGGKSHHTQEEGRQHGPLFDAGHNAKDSSIFDMMMLTKETDLMALPCATDYVDRLMSSPLTFCCHTCPDAGGDQHLKAAWASRPLELMADWWPGASARLGRRLPVGMTPMACMVLSLLFSLLFTAVLGFYVHEIGAKEGEAKVRQKILQITLLCCAVAYTLQEGWDLLDTPATGSSIWRRLCQHLSGYADFRWNLVDLAALVLLLTGLIAALGLEGVKVSEGGLAYYAVRQILAVAFALYCLRMLSTLCYFERLGLYISIIRTAFVADVVPFLIVNAFFLLSFGSLIVCLLFPGGKTFNGGQDYSETLAPSGKLTTDEYIADMFQRPLFAHFGEYSADSLRNCRKANSTESGCPHPLGNLLYSRFVLFFYLLIVSVLFVNVLIAKLSLTVNREDERARVIWRGFRAKLLAEFRHGSSPPLMLLKALLGLVRLCRWLLMTGGVRGGCRSPRDGDRAKTKAATASPEAGELEMREEVQTNAVEPAGSWTHSSINLQQAPDGYKEFLWLQAMQLRKFRSTLHQQQDVM